MTFDLEKYEEAIRSQDDTRRINAGLELAEAVFHIKPEELERFSQQIVDLLLESLHKTEWEFRNLISNAVVKLGKLDFIARSTWFWKKLISTYTNTDSGLRSSAMDLLKELGRSEYSLEILEPLIEGLQSKDKDMRILSANTLGRIRAKEVLPMLIEALHDDNTNVVYNVVECLGDIRDPRSVPALMNLLTTYPDEWVRVATLEALGKIGDQRVVDLLLSLVDKQLVVDPLISALGVLGDSRAIPILSVYLKDEDRDIRELTVNALVTIWEEVENIAQFTGVQYELQATRDILDHSLTIPSKNMLLQDMNNPELSKEFRENCAVLLSCIHYQKALIPTVQLLSSYPLSKKIIYAIESYGKRAFSQMSQLLTHEDDRIRQSAGIYLQSLAQHAIGHDSPLEQSLLTLAEDEQPIVKQIALDGLGMLKSPTTIPALLKILETEPHNYGETIIDILMHFPKRSVYTHIQHKIDDAKEDTLPLFLKILGSTTTQFDYFKKFFKHHNPQIQEASILAIGYTGNPQGIPLLLPFIMSRQNSLTRCAATQSLHQLITTLAKELPKPRNIFDALFFMLNTHRTEEELSVVAQALGTFCSIRFEEIHVVNIAVVRGRLLDLLPRVSNDTKIHLLQALARLVDMSSFSSIREFRRFNTREVQEMVALLYSRFERDLRVIADVSDMISHSEYSFRKYWILTAGKLSAIELTDMLVPLLAEQDFRIEAFQALTMIGQGVLPRLARWLTHEDPRIQKMTALVLARISQDHIDKFCKIPIKPLVKKLQR